MGAVCSACGSPLTAEHERLCLMWRTRNSRPIFFTVALLVLAILFVATIWALVL